MLVVLPCSNRHTSYFFGTCSFAFPSNQSQGMQNSHHSHARAYLFVSRGQKRGGVCLQAAPEPVPQLGLRSEAGARGNKTKNELGEHATLGVWLVLWGVCPPFFGGLRVDTKRTTVSFGRFSFREKTPKQLAAWIGGWEI